MSKRLRVLVASLAVIVSAGSALASDGMSTGEQCDLITEACVIAGCDWIGPRGGPGGPVCGSCQWECYGGESGHYIFSQCIEGCPNDDCQMTGYIVLDCTQGPWPPWNGVADEQ